MGLEIERKFLLRDDSWRNHVVKEKRILQSYLDRIVGQNPTNSTQRIRIETVDKSVNAFFTIKKATTSARVRCEWEFPIPVQDANELIDIYAARQPIQKIRHMVDYKGSMWEIDEFIGLTWGPTLIIAELELSSEFEEFVFPSWLGKEITDVPDYKNYSLYCKQPARS